MSWVACVEFLLKKIGVSTNEVYLPSVSSVVKRKLINRFKANLTKTLSKSSDTNQGRLRTYAYFKTTFQKEKYLSIINNVDIRKCFMSFRISAHKLEIEFGRYKNIPALNRICKVCSSGEVEDERHLIFSCNKYSSLRQSFFTETQKICKNFSTLIQDAQFFWLMNNEFEDVIIWTASSDFGIYRLCEQRRFRRASASAQSHQNLRCSLIQAVSQEEPSDKKPNPWPL